MYCLQARMKEMVYFVGSEVSVYVTQNEEVTHFKVPSVSASYDMTHVGH